MLAKNASKEPDAAVLYSSGVNSLSAYRDELEDLEGVVLPATQRAIEISASSDSLVNLTSATVTFVQPGVAIPLPSDLLEPSRADHAEIRAKLDQIDPALGNTYGSIREVLYGTREDPQRAALYLLRQTFDHFFSALAPDESVRDSKFFRPKSGERPDLVTRHERLMYAAHTHIANPGRRSSIIASFRHMLDIYDALSSAHKRDSLNKEQSVAALGEMLALLQDWIRSI